MGTPERLKREKGSMLALSGGLSTLVSRETLLLHLARRDADAALNDSLRAQRFKMRYRLTEAIQKESNLP
jgi:hypothetical protein